MKKVITILNLLADKIDEYSDFPCLGYTSTTGRANNRRLSFGFFMPKIYLPLMNLSSLPKTIKGKGMKGTVGTAASYKELLKDLPGRQVKQYPLGELESKSNEKLGD